MVSLTADDNASGPGIEDAHALKVVIFYRSVGRCVCGDSGYGVLAEVTVIDGDDTVALDSFGDNLYFRVILAEFDALDA